MAAPYVPVDPRPWRLTMGLRPLAPADWLQVDGHRHAELTRKWELLDDPVSHRRVVATTGQAEEGGAELLGLVVRHLDTHHPGLVGRGGGDTLVDTTVGRPVEVDRLDPVDAAGRLVQEDLCLMHRTGAGWVLAAASVCFPSRWSLADKIGADLDAIHGPVPGYGAALGGPVAKFFDRVAVDRPVWRLNWTLVDDPALHLPAAGGEHRSTEGGDPGAQLWFRVERQTLRRLAGTGDVVFTIRTYVTGLADLLDADASAGDALLAHLPTVPAATVAYKGWDHMLPDLLRWLAQRAAGGSPGP